METLNIKDTLSIMNLGSEAQTQFSGLSECAFGFLRNSNLEPVGEMLSEMLDFFRDSSEKTTVQKEKMCAEVDAMKEQLDEYHVRMIMDCEALATFRGMNKNYNEELSEAIKIGKEALPDLMNDTDSDVRNRYSALEKRIKELELTQAVCSSFEAQMAVVQANEAQMADRIQSTLVNALSMWKSRLVIEEQAGKAVDAKNAELMQSINEVLQLQRQGVMSAEEVVGEKN